MTTNIVVFRNPKVETDDLSACNNLESWKLFTYALRPWRASDASVVPTTFLHATNISVLLSLLLDAPLSIQIGLVTASFVALGIMVLYSFAETGNFRLARFFVTVGRRPLTPDELLRIVKWAPTPKMREGIREIVAANSVVRIRHMLPLHAEADQTAKRLEKAGRDLEIARARDFVLNSKGKRFPPLRRNMGERPFKPGV